MWIKHRNIIYRPESLEGFLVTKNNGRVLINQVKLSKSLPATSEISNIDAGKIVKLYARQEFNIHPCVMLNYDGTTNTLYRHGVIIFNNFTWNI